ncbi:MAG: hypothetical protein GEU28_14345, partial [Dehalococcoidia bacterium]|nr:hypothetical protein [Dehalococcoidia bacterium]
PYVLVFIFAAVICIWRYLEVQRPHFLYLFALFLGLAFATMEITYIYVAIMLIYVDVMLAVELAKSPEGRTDSVKALYLAPFAWLIAALWPLLGKRPFGRDRLPPIGDVMVVLGTLSLTQFGPAVETIPFVGDKGYNVPEEETLRNITLTVLLVGATYVGLLWRPKVWAIVAAAFFIPYFLLFTTFFTNMGGAFSGIWGSLDYWLAQQDVQRGNQPGYYYALMSPLYEFLPLLVALPGAIWLALKGNSLTRFLLFWLTGIFIGLTLAGEKMPWLEVHIALPLALCAAVVLARVVDSFEMDAKRWLTAAGVAGGCVVATLLLVEGDSSLTTVAGLLVGALALGWVIGSTMGEGRAGLARALTTVAIAVLFTLSVRASLTVSYKNYDTPVEMLVYTQSSAEIPALMDRIDSLARESGLGYNIPIVVDQTDGYAWPWAWYLRHYHDVAYINDVTGYEPKPGSVLLIHANNASQVDGVGYSQVPYKHRWWFNETYRDLSFGKVLDIVTSPERLQSLGKFFLYRRPAEGTTGSTDSVAFFPESLAAFDKAQPVRPAPEPTTLADGRVVFGRPGSSAGEILQAADVVVDPAGNVWIADARNNRIHKFDAQGRYVSSLGRGGVDPGSFNQPWSLAIDAQGFIYVADTWNHRIQKFDAEGTFIKAWGGVTNSQQPGLLDLYGPRDIIVDVDGTLWVSDTGHKRLINYTTDGEPLGSIGVEGTTLGQFSEPVGLAVDLSGRLLVADTWNARIQAIANAGSITSFATGWASQGINDKPYLAVLTDGSIVATDPARSLLTLYSPEGAVLGTWTPAAGGLPIGIASLPDGGFVFSDGRRNEVQIVPAAAIPSLFQ